MRTVRSLREAGAAPRLVVLGFKPQKLDEVALELRSYLNEQTVVISLLAGVEVSSLRERFPAVAAVVRAMPNLPVAIRRGVTALYGEGLDEYERQQISDLFAPLGFTLWAVD
jgi:pyrroline-5-carboxylate reductase